MAKVILSDITNLDNPQVAVGLINTNMARIAAAFENTLSRDGDTPNNMGDELNMDGERIIGLPAPTSDTEPARHGDIQTYVEQAEDSATAAAASEDVVVAAEEVVIAAEANIEAIWDDVQVYGTPAFYDIVVFAGGTLSDNETIFQFVAPRGFTIASGAAGQASAGTAATASNVITIKKNNTNIGTLTWGAAATVATVNFASPTTFVAGDFLRFVNQADSDDTLANVSIAIVANRQP